MDCAIIRRFVALVKEISWRRVLHSHIFLRYALENRLDCSFELY